MNFPAASFGLAALAALGVAGCAQTPATLDAGVPSSANAPILNPDLPLSCVWVENDRPKGMGYVSNDGSFYLVAANGRSIAALVDNRSVVVLADFDARVHTDFDNRIFGLKIFNKTPVNIRDATVIPSDGALQALKSRYKFREAAEETQFKFYKYGQTGLNAELGHSTCTLPEPLRAAVGGAGSYGGYSGRAYSTFFAVKGWGLGLH